ncbi:MAG: bifunctional DNA-formamidopyrimidine glycosylase/DNA-(apurinic or apyrimidinic site) lyase [Candidatus Pacebacteria bacterium]|nr:bifunctional DNA-formamidopyrimidine glycosylase/DNA-(apurinic or apyrimidinic site) lyase [Candidatus Paceibacterota bacterium]
MPELPEVQTIINDLRKVLPGLKIFGVWTDFPKMIKHPASSFLFEKKLIRSKFLKVERRGKNILFYLSGGKTLLIHQKMTGHLMYGKWRMEKNKWLSVDKGPLLEDPQNRFIHLVFELSNKKQLALSDVRKFSKVLIWKTSDLENLKDIKNIGVDPVSADFTIKTLEKIFKNKKGKIRDVLMNQEIISGIGNIYASEILWEAGLHPFCEVSRFNKKDFVKLRASIKKILNQAIKSRGDSIIDYRDLYGRKGGYQHKHKAYQMEGKKCAKKDGGIIKRIKVKGRSAFYCPVHQKL